MKNLTIENIVLACGGELYGGDGLTKEEAQGVVLDSRLLSSGGVFIATKGERVDGHRFIPEVFARGALAVICEELPKPLPGPCILVKDSFQALKDVARYYRSRLNIKVIGITGSVGKTSTKEFIAGVLAKAFPLWKTQGNFNNEVGLPLTILQIKEEHQIAVLEMGISQFGEMRRLSEMAKPDICVITNIGECHLEALGDRDGVLKAKLEILDFWNREGLICVNGDDDKLITLKEKYGDRVVTFGRNRANDYYPSEEISRGLLGSRISIDGRIHIPQIDVPLPGEHMVLNALAATAIAHTLGMSQEEIREGIRGVQSVAGRSHVVELKDYVLIDDCYNANPVSMKAALDLLQEAAGRRVAVLGDMFELGREEEAMHRQVGAYAAEEKTDILFCVGKLSEAMYGGAMEAAAKNSGKPAPQIVYAREKEELYSLLKEALLPGDTILLKASHGMEFAKVAEWLKKNLA